MTELPVTRSPARRLADRVMRLQLDQFADQMRRLHRLQAVVEQLVDDVSLVASGVDQTREYRERLRVQLQAIEQGHLSDANAMRDLHSAHRGDSPNIESVRPSSVALEP